MLVSATDKREWDFSIFYRLYNGYIYLDLLCCNGVAPGQCDNMDSEFSGPRGDVLGSYIGHYIFKIKHNDHHQKYFFGRTISYCLGLVPAKDTPFALILWYLANIIYLS